MSSSTQEKPGIVSRLRSWKYAMYTATAMGPVFLTCGLLLWTAIFSSPDFSDLRTHTAARGEFVVTVASQGTLESAKNTEIKCQVRGGYGGRGGRSTVTWVIPSGTIVKKGDVLVRLDTKIIEETVSLGKTDTNIAKASLARAKADLAKAEIAIDAYLKGRYRTQLQGLENQRKVALRNRKNANTRLQNSESLFEQGYVNKLNVEGSQFTVKQAELELSVTETEIDVLTRLTKSMELETLNGQLVATRARLQGRKAGLELEQGRLDLALIELENCVIRAPQDGLVIYPSTAKWKNSPDITEGASVHNNQVLLLMPDLSQMQVTVGIHESIIERVRPGLEARVKLPDRTLESKVALVAEVASPAGWWTGNVVNYDTTIRLSNEEGLNPGKTAEVELTLARYDDVLSIPVASVVETDEGHFCWVQSDTSPQKRALQLSDSNDEFVMVESGLEIGDQVVLDPALSIEDARMMLEPSLVHPIERGELLVTVTEQGTLESSENTKIKCRVRGASRINWVIANGTEVQAGDELVRLENKQIEDYLHERTKYAHLSRDTAIGFRAQEKRAELAIAEFLEGRYRTQLMTLEKDSAILEANLRSVQNQLDHAHLMAKSEYVSQLELDDRKFAVERSRLSLEAKQGEAEILKRFTKDEQLVTLKGNWEAAKAAANGHEEVLAMDEERIALAKTEMERCVIKAERSGLVIYPTSEEWKGSPDIDEGVTVHNDQVLLLMPDLSKMQVKVGIHESMVKSIQPGMLARVTLPGRILEGKVASVAPVADAAGWWSGNIVKYDTVIELPAAEGLKPGMSAEVEIILNRLDDALKIPHGAVLESEEGHFCWVGSTTKAERREIELGEGNEAYIEVKAGIEQGESVVLHPTEHFDEAKQLQLSQADGN